MQWNSQWAAARRPGAYNAAMHRMLGFVAGSIGALAVVLDALGAHLWRPALSEVAFESFQTGVRYLLMHAVALLALAASPRLGASRLMRICAIGIILGTLLFGLGLVLWTTREWAFARRCAPWGGSLLIFSWSGLAVAALIDRRSRT